MHGLGLRAEGASCDPHLSRLLTSCHPSLLTPQFGGWVLSIPNCVLGGMTTYLFANVITSGIKLLIAKGPISRRDRVILAWSLGFGIGLSIVPQW